MLTMVPPRRPADGPPIDPEGKTKFDWTTRLSLDTIRHHTKTDDVPGVTDEQLELYREAAIEAAEKYTGMLLAGQRTVTEVVEGPSHPKPGKYTYKHTLQYPVADGLIYLYGSPDPSNNRRFMVPIGTRTIRVPILKDYIDLSCPCDPCSQPWHLNGGMMAAYKAGFKCPDDVPAGIVLGCLQFLAWIVEHPGDELLTQRNRKDNSTKIGGVSGSNNIAMVSGALETWRLYDDGAV